jgi:hypothetical protein
MQGDPKGFDPAGGGFLRIPQKKIRLLDSELLGERIVLVDADSDVGDATHLYPDRVIYSHSEVSKILGVTSETLKEIHGIKKAFHGKISLVAAPSEPGPALPAPPSVPVATE